MQKTCKQCAAHFEITDDDFGFYERVSAVFNGKTELIPPPTLCPSCRMQRRFAIRNERYLHKRTCDLTGKSMVSFFRQNVLCTVYDKDAWWSDAWDGTAYGQDMDFSRSFFKQFAELRAKTPRLGMVMSQDEGSAYSPYCVSTKNCYMCVSCVVNEDSYYSYQANDSKNCVDCSNVTRCEMCYECVYCYGLYDCIGCKDCENGSVLRFCEDCRGCTDCIGCKNLVNKKHHIFNAQVSEEEFLSAKAQLLTYSGYQRYAREFHAFAMGLPTRHGHMKQCESCTGDHLVQCRNARNCFDCINLEDGKNICPMPQNCKDSHDANYSPDSELLYECVSTLRASRIRFSSYCWDADDILYSDECFSCKNLFGCAGLRQKQYCVLNKQCTKEEYEELVPKIIQKMRADGEFGEFFPITQSAFAYNKTIAQDEFPLQKDAVHTKGWLWEDPKDDLPQVQKIISGAALPDDTRTIPDDILNWAIECMATKRPFKIIKQELAFYRSQTIPVPRLHPEERYRLRMKKRNPRRLWTRECAKCNRRIETTYAPNRPEIVYCEECYLKEVY